VGLRIAFERITRDSGSLDEEARRIELEALLGRDLEVGRLFCWVACARGAVVAQAALRRLPRDEGELLNIYTDPAYRIRGIGSSLVGLAIAEARAIGLRRISLQPTDSSMHIYELAGFRAAGGSMVLGLEC
jgi:N-acetylglutamate synthase-like GNAT family acetyltransferase